MKKRICSLLVLCLVLALLPAAHALAAEEEIDSLEVGFLRMDHSIVNENGEIELFYDLLVVPQTYPYRLQMDMTLVEEYYDYVLSIQGLDEYLSVWPEVQYYYDTLAGDVRYNREGLLSLCYSMDWYMGGVHNYGWHGVNFDLNTGERIGMDELLDMSAESIMELLRPVIQDYAEANGGWERSELESIGNAYTLEDLDFYVDRDGEVILCFPQYELGPGASGPMAIPTGLYAEGAPRESGEESLLDILMSPSGGTAQGIELRDVQLTPSEQYEINVFLSNFAEQGFYDYPGSGPDHVTRMANFAHMYCKINDRSGIEYMQDNGSSYETVSLDKVNKILDRFFGETLTAAEAGSGYESDWGFYRDGRFWYPAADGESYNTLAVADYMDEVYDGVYFVSFTVYELDLDVYFGEGLTRAYYELTPEAASASSVLDPVGYGAAIVAPYDLDGRATYQLLEYQSW